MNNSIINVAIEKGANGRYSFFIHHNNMEQCEVQKRIAQPDLNYYPQLHFPKNKMEAGVREGDIHKCFLEIMDTKNFEETVLVREMEQLFYQAKVDFLNIKVE